MKEKTNKGGKTDTRQRYLFRLPFFRVSVSVRTDRTINDSDHDHGMHHGQRSTDTGGRIRRRLSVRHLGTLCMLSLV